MTRDAADLIPEAMVSGRARRGPALVWIIPLVAALLGGWLAIKTFIERGPTVTLAFETGEGLEAGKTKLKYKDVDIGIVQRIALAGDRTGVVATAQVAKQAAHLLVQDTRFWVVRPRISGGSVSGLGTLLGGAYIGVDPGKASASQHHFTGLETPPVVTLDVPGSHFALRADDLGSLDVASPVYFRRVQVGQVVSVALDEDGGGVTLQVFVRAPYDQHVSANTRFWNASGFDVSLDAGGIKVETQSMVSILVGGIAFQTPGSAGAPAPAAASVPVPVPHAATHKPFALYADRAQALKNPDLFSETYVAVFKDSLRGLSVGAPVDFRGITLGEVTAINVRYDTATQSFSMPVELRIYPERLKSRARPGHVVLRDVVTDPGQRLDFMVRHGVRAQLRTGNLLTGQLYVALDFFPDAPKTKLNLGSDPLELPTVPGAITELQASVGKIAGKLEKVPLDEISADLRRALKTLDATLRSTHLLVNNADRTLTPEARATLEGARRSLAAVEDALAHEAPLQLGIRETLRDLSRAADSVRVLTDTLERHPEALLKGKKKDTP